MSTIKDIAAEAGVSVMTVSNVINNNHTKVSPATERRIRAIMAKHNYVPNMAARSLISKSSRIIGMLLPVWHGSISSVLRDPCAGQPAELHGLCLPGSLYGAILEMLSGC